ncbi:MAG TPA: hypothetical protein VMU46_00575, partial [Burkholderiales bacterium]|nr:hypothetical protein [Burkholderiales bacterium]
MSRLLRAICVAVLALATTATALAATGEHSLAEWSVGALAETKARIETLAGDLAKAPGELRSLSDETRSSVMSGTGVRAFTYLLILLLVGGGAEWLYWTYAYSPLRAIQAVPVRSPREALRAGLRRLVLLGSGLLLFTVATIGASAAFSWPPGVQELVVAATLLVVVLRLAWVIVMIVVAPGRAQLRLVPVEPLRARWLAALTMTVVCLLALGRFVPDLMERLSGARHAAGALRLAAMSATALLLFVAAFAFFGRPGRGEGAGRTGAPRFPRSFILAMLVVAVYAIWLMNAQAAPIAAILAAVVALQMGLRELVFFFWQDESPAHDGGAADGVLPSIVLSAARFAVVLAGLGACVLALDAPLANLAESGNPSLRLGLRVLGVATLALLTNFVWITVRTAIDQRLGRIRPPDSHDGPDESARLLTLLPLLRVSAAVFLLVMLVLSSL